MERVTKALLILTALLVAVSLEVEGGRMIQSSSNEQVDHPQNFFGGAAGGAFPGPGFAGFGFGPNGFYTFPGTGNAPGLPTIPGTPSHA
ncbi:hypothetical protein PanWU01x14_087230 [Parasponia andersonii]|uniref:Glycine-rich protein n=1 Tax=Parasponia andersonii TaxID=3476 RepID=A0A2P5D8G0_PARAD|nr:hypothetical protein PanWU01x14_087230 [Parasponia andersonii]